MNPEEEKVFETEPEVFEGFKPDTTVDGTVVETDGAPTEEAVVTE